LGLLLGQGRFFGSDLRIKPPMCPTRADGDVMIDVWDMALGEL
jgi:hypothetical protein